MRLHQTYSEIFDKLYNDYARSKNGSALLKIEGIDRMSLDIGNMSKQYFTTSHISDMSIDSNASANEGISPSNYAAEITKGLMKLEGYYLLHHYAEQRFGVERANELIKAIWDGDVYCHDASGFGITVPYCYSYSTDMIMLEGRPYGQLKSLPPKRADSFIGEISEVTMDLSQDFAGAIAIADLFVNYAWYAAKENLSDVTIINQLQHFVHVMNNKFRVASQSPFTNISIFDRTNLEKLFGNKIYPDGTKVDIEYVMHIQKLFAEWFAKGDPSTGLPYRFPIATCLSGNTDIFIYMNDMFIKDTFNNIFSDMPEGWNNVEGLKTLDEHGELVDIRNIYKNHVSEPLYCIKFANGMIIQTTANHQFPTKSGLKEVSDMNNNDQVAYCNISNKCSIVKGGVFDQSEWIKVESIETIKYSGFVYDINVDNESHLYTLPSGIITHNCNITKNRNGKIVDEEFLNWVSNINMRTGCFNIYVNDGYKVASCCRLINDQSRMQFKSDTYGNGGLNIGSHRVVTINLPRLSLKSKNMADFYVNLDIALEICRDLLIVHRCDILQRRIDQGFLKFFNPLKWFSLKHLFSTIGIIGVYEMDQLRKYGPTDHIEFITSTLKFIEDRALKFSNEYKCSFNVEEIPGESVAPKLCAKDKIMFGTEAIPYAMYSNQYVPLIADADITTRIKTTGKFMDILSGGGILHLNIAEQITDPATMRHLIEYAVRYGVSHLAINYGFGVCENNHTTVCGNKTECPICGKPIVEWTTRIVGYFTKTTSWGQTRREYEFPRRVFNGTELV